MHVPDGFLGPQTYVPATVVGAGLWSLGIARVRRRLDAVALPRVGVLTALAFVLMMISIPIPGGSTVHFGGVALLALTFGGWTAFVCISLVLLMQAGLFGVGGITSVPVAALLIGFVGAWTAVGAHRLLRALGDRVALFGAGWFSVVVPAALMAVVLGLQPALAAGSDGRPLFFPFGLDVTLTAVIVPHLLVGVGEGLLTVMMIEALRRIGVEPVPAGGRA